MRINDVNPVGVLSMTAVPVVRAHEGTRVFAPAMGVEAVVAVSAEQVSVEQVAVQQVACLHVAKSAADLWLKSLLAAGMAPALPQGSAAGVALEDRGYGDLSQQRRIQDGPVGFQGTTGFFGGRVSTTGTNGDTSSNGTNPIDPRDFRTSSPPG